MSKTRYVIEITQLINWHGKLTGIPRVMHELGQRFNKNNQSIFVKWNGSNFEEVSFPDNRESESRGLDIEEHPPAKSSTLLKKSKSIVGKNRLVRYVYSKVFLNKYSDRNPVANKYQPKKGDKLLVIWGEWADQKYIDALFDMCISDRVDVFHVSNDIIPILLPHFSGHSTVPQLSYVKKIFPVCSGIFSISSSTGKDLKEWLKKEKLNIPLIKVFRLGDDFKSDSVEAPKSKKSKEFIKNPFIICVGTIEARKNHTLLYYTYKLAKSRKVTLPKLIIIGRRGWKTENIYDFITEDPEVKNDILVLENVSDEELSWFYKHATFTIYPSFYEGWGLPIAESLANQTPCIASGTSSMQEIAGDLVDYFNPASTDECLSAILRASRPEYLKKIKMRAERYRLARWDDSYQAIIDGMEKRN